jgi:hypothetical protein
MITEPVSLGTLWASLPDLSQLGAPPGLIRPDPLVFLADEAPERRPRATVLIPGEMPSGPAFITRFGEIMADYPSAEGFAIPAEENSILPPGSFSSDWRVVVRWPATDSQPEMSEEQLNAFYDEVAPEYRYRGDRFLRPAVGAARSAPPSPLMTWWLLLYSFSILARYEPRRYCCSARWKVRSPWCRTWCSRRSTASSACFPRPWRSRNPIGPAHVIGVAG